MTLLMSVQIWVLPSLGCLAPLLDNPPRSISKPKHFVPAWIWVKVKIDPHAFLHPCTRIPWPLICTHVSRYVPTSSRQNLIELLLHSVLHLVQNVLFESVSFHKCSNAGVSLSRYYAHVLASKN